MKRTLMAVMVTAALATAGFVSAQATQTPTVPPPDTKSFRTESDLNAYKKQGEVTAEQLAEAKSIAAKAGIACTVNGARFVGKGKEKAEGGGREDVSLYEVSCDEKLGWIVADRSKTGVTAYNCIMAAKSTERLAAEKKKFGEVCKMPVNLDFKPGIDAQVQRAAMNCTVAQWDWLGRVPDGDRYEVACSSGHGYILDVPTAPGQPVKPLNCLRAADAGVACGLTPKDKQVAVVAAVAAKSGRDCTVSDARFVGSDTNKGSDYYEVGCAAGKAGYMFEADAKGDYIRAVDCTRAANIGGGCKLTDAGAAQAAAGQSYAERLKASGVSCSVTQHRLIGQETSTKREVVEFACADKPTGLIAFIPAAGKAETMDCITGESRSVKCQLTERAAIMGAISNALTAGGKSCPVKVYRVLGPSAGDGEVLEAACDNGKGYIVDLPLSRAKPDMVLSCQQSASRGGDKCTLPENAGALQGNS